MASVTIKSYAKERQKEILAGLSLALRRAAIVVENQAKENVDQTPPAHPQVQTSRLRSSISHNWSGSGITHGQVEPPAKAQDGVSEPSEELAVHIGTNVYYGKILEHGSVKMPAYPWLYPALEVSKLKIIDALQKTGARNINIG